MVHTYQAPVPCVYTHPSGIWVCWKMRVPPEAESDVPLLFSVPNQKPRLHSLGLEPVFWLIQGPSKLSFHVSSSSALFHRHHHPLLGRHPVWPWRTHSLSQHSWLWKCQWQSPQSCSWSATFMLTATTCPTWCICSSVSLWFSLGQHGTCTSTVPFYLCPCPGSQAPPHLGNPTTEWMLYSKGQRSVRPDISLGPEITLCAPPVFCSGGKILCMAEGEQKRGSWPPGGMAIQQIW